MVSRSVTHSPAQIAPQDLDRSSGDPAVIVAELVRYIRWQMYQHRALLRAFPAARLSIPFLHASLSDLSRRHLCAPPTHSVRTPHRCRVLVAGAELRLARQDVEHAFRREVAALEAIRLARQQ